MKSSRAFQYSGHLLLANLVGWNPIQLKEAMDEKDDYHIVYISKSNGKKRKISIPPGLIHTFQRRLLKNFFYRMLRVLIDPSLAVIDDSISSFLPEKSIITNARVHAAYGLNHTIRLDLKDAFPSVTGEVLAPILKKIVLDEITLYEKERDDTLDYWEYKNFPRKRKQLFPRSKVSWFRWLIKETTPQRALKTRLYANDCIDVMVDLLTHEGRLPQGAPTSPFLLNLALSQTGVVQEVSSLVRSISPHYRLSVYADDFTISTSHDIKKHINDIIALIEEKGIFTVNRSKTLRFDRRQIAPMITGLRVIDIPLSQKEMERQATKVKGMKSKLDKGETFFTHGVTAPKILKRRIRGLLYAALSNPDLRNQAFGYVSYLQAIYGKYNLPRQIAVPYERLKSSEHTYERETTADEEEASFDQEWDDVFYPDEHEGDTDTLEELDKNNILEEDDELPF